MGTSVAIQNPHLQGDAFYWHGGNQGVLLIHGFTATTAEVRLLAEILHQHDYTIAAPLLPGHYSSPDDLNKVKWQDWVATSESSYQQLASECKQVFIGGESTGGLLALYLASQHPEAAGVLTYAPALRLNMSTSQRLLLSLLSPFVPYIHKPTSESGPKDDIPWQGYPVYPLKGAAQLLKLQDAVSALLPRIDQPVLIIQGRQDASVHPSVPGFIANQVSSDTVAIHWMKASSHVVILDKELGEVAELTLDFMQHALERTASSEQHN